MRPFALAGLLVSSVVATADAVLPDHRMVLKRGPPPHALNRRQNSVTVSGGQAGATGAAGGNNAGQNGGNANQNGGNGNQNGGGNNAATTAAQGNDGGLAGVVTSLIDGGVDRITSTAPAPTITQPAPVDSVARPTTTIPKTTSTVAPTVVQITQTSTFSQSSLSGSATLAAASASTTAPPSSGGLSHGTLIAVIVVASCVALVAGGWTLIRKWKLGPSRRFEDKLQPLDFEPGPGHLAGAGFETRFPPNSTASLNRVDSNGSSGYGGGLKRGNSYGSAAGSQRGAGHQQTMSEVSYAQSQNRGRYGALDAPAAGQQPFAPPRGAGNLHNPYGGASEYDYDPGLGAAAPGGGYARY